ncbi:MAG TPA: sulfite exporter TauE/SafE family protein [Kaistella sp.]|uniref:sulfite exporter TauE/SafE family protein n=1 Tax=Candidatus Kaistella beijingensis TaxID=2820270 RepID=UPI001AD1172F|nr:sulfite exporter TauE/SafE family protein [Candidatus Kaistella beijingensis]MBN8621870.1 sulfite exporter TauE/SafE family protein [Flavobacteriales bacterium]MCA0391047.1 sulfite exporter TauE/SafE family protein [Bacteroidota bacterium]UBB88910.1 sulfite exporter TauE/SafE family protein [Candidatus Kaistella beijingensis]HMU06324.1 sulfite exporter TauE/SafE family protein [Kaistella sp.]
MEIIGYLSAIIIGLVMGLIGGGGSILSVPIFVYVFGFDAVTATALSLFVVGVTSLVGSAGFIKQKQIDFQTAFIFGIPSILGVLFSRRLVLPHLPHYIINRWGITLTKDMFLLLLFSILMLIASFKMIRRIERPRLSKDGETNYTILVSQGLLVGIITGLIGAGGGFLIVPALVMLLGLNMKRAVATSLFIIAMNSTLGFLSTMKMVKHDWTFLLTFSALSVVGIFIGTGISKKMDGKKLKPLFGWIVLAMGIFIIIKEVFLKQQF